MMDRGERLCALGLLVALELVWLVLLVLGAKGAIMTYQSDPVRAALHALTVAGGAWAMMYIWRTIKELIAP